MIAKTENLTIYDKGKLWPDYYRKLAHGIKREMPQVEAAMKFLLGLSSPTPRVLFAVEISLLLRLDSDERIRIKRLAFPPVLKPSEVWSVTVSGSYSDGIEGLVKYEYSVSLPNETCWIEDGRDLEDEQLD